MRTRLFLICVLAGFVILWLPMQLKLFYSNLQSSSKARKDNEVINQKTEFCSLQRDKDILKPCQNHSNYSEESKTLANYSLVKVHPIKNDGAKPLRIEIQTFDLNKNPKTLGGDYWLGFLEIKTMKYALRFIDYGNGRYIAYFRPHLAGSYTLHLTLEHSLCDGLLDPPSNWFQLGDSHGRYQNEDGFKISDTLLTEAIQPINFEVPSSEIKNRKANFKCQRENCILNTNHGYWSGKNFIDLATGRPVTEFVSRKFIKRKLKSFAAFGDSLTYRFYGSIKEKCLTLFYFCNPVYTWSYKVKKKELKNKIIYDGLDFDESRFLGEIHAAMKGKTVFLINFGLHHVSTLPMERCFRLFQQFIKLVKIKRKKGIGPLVIWKTTTPPFLENRQDKSKNADWHHYRTKQRIEVWNSYTIEECCKAGIDVLDVYEMALSSPKKTLDGVHYPNTVFNSVENDLFNFIFKRFRSKL